MMPFGANPNQSSGNNKPKRDLWHKHNQAPNNSVPLQPLLQTKPLEGFEPYAPSVVVTTTSPPRTGALVRNSTFATMA
jgi:hypothetical protein